MLALVVVLTGCGGPTSVAPDSTVTPAPLPETDTQGKIAPGVTGDGVVDARTLANAHVAHLENRSYTLTVKHTVRYENATLREQLFIRLLLTADRKYVVATRTTGPEAPLFLGKPSAQAVFWSDGSQYARRLTRDGTTTVTEFQPSDGAGSWRYWARTAPFGGGVSSPRAFFSETLSAIPTRLEGSNRMGEDTVYQLVGDDSSTAINGIENPRAVLLQLNVTATGLVRSLSLKYNGTVEGELVTATRTVRYTAVGDTTVGRPEWVDKALE
jgi:hypothetical protein